MKGMERLPRDGGFDEEGAAEVLSFWLEEVGVAGWYKIDPLVDAACAERFGALIAKAADGGLRCWARSPRGTLALLILLDQFPRNVHRGMRAAFASDRLALSTAKGAIRRRFDLAVPEPARQFLYLPLMHSENLADQERCVRLCLLRLPESGAENLKHAVLHRDVIRRFGRFPSRNAILGRPDTPPERAYREAGGYMS